MDHFSDVEKELLKDCFLLNQLSESNYNEFLNISKRIYLEKDVVLLKEGKDSDDFYIIISGSAHLYKDEKNKIKKTFIGTLNSGQTIGEMRIIQNRPCSLTVKIAEPTVLLQTSINELHANTACYESILISIGMILNERLFNSNQIVLDKIIEKRRKNTQFLFAAFFAIVLAIFLCEAGLALYYALYPTDFCKAITAHPLPAGNLF